MAIIRHVKCPFPNCNHSGEVLTNNHCVTIHGISKKDVIKEYGAAQKVMSDDRVAKKNKEAYEAVGNVNPSYVSHTKHAKESREDSRSGHRSGIQVYTSPQNSSKNRIGG